MHVVIGMGAGECAAQAGYAGARTWASETGQFQAARCFTARDRRQAGRRQRVLQQREQRDWCQVICYGLGQEAQEDGGRRVAQRFPGTVIGDHAVAQQLGGDPSGEVTIRRYQSGGGLRRLQCIT